MCSSWFTYLPTYLLTNLPANLRVQSPRPVHHGTLLFVCVLLLAISSRLSFTIDPPLACSTNLVYFPLFLSSRRSPFSPLLRFTVSVFATPIATTPCALPSPTPLFARATQFYSPIHSAYSPPYTQPPLVAASPAPSRLTAPRHATTLPVPASTSHDSQRVAFHESRRERSLIFRFVHEAARRGGYHTPRERTWTRSTKRSPDGAEQRG